MKKRIFLLIITMIIIKVVGNSDIYGSSKVVFCTDADYSSGAYGCKKEFFEIGEGMKTCTDSMFASGSMGCSNNYIVQYEADR